MTAPLNFFDWLYDTRELQVEAFGVNPGLLEGGEFAEYIRWNTLAAQVELSEFVQELEWKPWRDGNGRPSPEARERAVEELVDVLHFIANLLVANRVSGHELTRAYRAKQQVNRERQAGQAEEATQE